MDGIADEATFTYTPVTSNVNQDLILGAKAGGSYLFNGELDNVMLFDRALSQEEIEGLYSEGIGNRAPTANAGNNQTVTDTDEGGSEQVTLDGSGSYDSDGTIISWVWSDNLGDTIPDGVNVTADLAVGTHTITLTVTDSDGATDTDTVVITVETPTAEPPISGLVGYWKLDDNTNTTTVADNSGNGNDGTAKRNTSELSTTGVIDGALTFNGSGDYIDCGNDSNLDITGDFTIAFWIKTLATADQFIMYKSYGHPSIGYSVQIYGGAIRFRDRMAWLQGTQPVNNGDWHHVSVRVSGSVFSFYVDGIADEATFTYTPITSNVNQDLILGAKAGGSYLFNGELDNVMLFDRALSQEEIEGLYSE